MFRGYTMSEFEKKRFESEAKRLRPIEKKILKILHEARDFRSGYYEAKADLRVLLNEFSYNQLSYTIQKLEKRNYIKRIKRGVYGITPQGVKLVNASDIERRQGTGAKGSPIYKEPKKFKGEEKITLPTIGKIGSKYILENVPYETHRRGKNYAAKIEGLDPKYKFKRDFLERGTKGSYVFDEKPQAGTIYEIQAIYYTGSGSPSPQKGSGFYELQSDGSFKKLSESEVEQHFKQTIEETF